MDTRPDGFGSVRNNPKLEVWMVDDGDEFPSGGRDLVVLSLEVDGVVVIDAARGAQGEVGIEQG